VWWSELASRFFQFRPLTGGVVHVADGARPDDRNFVMILVLDSLPADKMPYFSANTKGNSPKNLRSGIALISSN